MPIYEYRCAQGHQFETLQRMSDEPVKQCEVCEQPVERVFHPVAIHFKGSGFYNTDYGKRKHGADVKAGSGGGESGADKASKPSESSKGDKQKSSEKAASTK